MREREAQRARGWLHGDKFQMFGGSLAYSRSIRSDLDLSVEAPSFANANIIAGRGPQSAGAIDSAAEAGGQPISSEAAKPGRVEIAGGPGSYIGGRILAMNGGSIEISLRSGEHSENGSNTLSSGSALLDDFSGIDRLHSAGGSLLSRQYDPTRESATEPGSITLRLENASWQSEKRNILTNLIFAGDKSEFDIIGSKGSSLLVNSLSGNGTVLQYLSDESSQNGDRLSDMLYVDTLEADAAVRLLVSAEPETTADDLKGIRFATTRENRSSLGERVFSVELVDQGFFDRTIAVRTKPYAKSYPENAGYNGASGRAIEQKPGTDYVDALFGEGGTNWYLDGFADITNPDEPDPNQPNPDRPDPNVEGAKKTKLSSIGRGILSTARALYWETASLERKDERTDEGVHGRFADSNIVLWTKLKHDRLGTDHARRSSAAESDFDSKVTRFQFGAETPVAGTAVASTWGAAIDYAASDVEHRMTAGSADIDRLGLLLYATFTWPSGIYADLTGRAARLKADSTVRTSTGEGLHGPMKHNLFSASLELGRLFDAKTTGLALGHWFFEPQLQVRYARLSGSGYHTGEIRVQTGDVASLIGRAGMRAGRTFGEKVLGKHFAYLRGDVLHEWLGETRVRAFDMTTPHDGARLSMKNRGTWFNAGAGLDWQVSSETKISLDASTRFGQALARNWALELADVRAF